MTYHETQKDHTIELYARFREQGLSEVDAVMMIARQTGRAIWDIRIDLGMGIEEA